MAAKIDTVMFMHGCLVIQFEQSGVISKKIPSGNNIPEKILLEITFFSNRAIRQYQNIFRLDLISNRNVGFL